MYYTEGKRLPSNKWRACSTSNFMYVCTYVAGDVGRDRVGGAVLVMPPPRRRGWRPPGGTGVTQLPTTAPPHSSHHMYSQVNVKPDEKEHTNSSVGTHNIAIGGTLG